MLEMAQQAELVEATRLKISADTRTLARLGLSRASAR